MANVFQRIDGLIVVCDVCLFVWLFAISEEFIDEKCYLVFIRV